MDQHGVPAVLPVEAPRGVAEKDDRKFQALGLVHGEDLYGGDGGGAERGLLPAFGKTPQPEHETVQSAVAAVLEALGERGHLHQTCPALFPIAHGAAKREQIQLLNQPPDELGGTQVRRVPPQSREPVQKAPAARIVLSGRCKSGIEVTRP